MRKPLNPIDVHVGSRVRMRRMMLKMSQSELGDALGVTFQQVQKYEKGTNRISASRLQRISDVLQVPVSFFFEHPRGPTGGSGGQKGHSPDYVSHFLTTTDGLSLAKAFVQIQDSVLRRRIVRLVQEIAHDD